MAHLLFPEEVLQQLSEEEPLPDEPWEFEDEEDEVMHTSEKQSEDT